MLSSHCQHDIVRAAERDASVYVARERPSLYVTADKLDDVANGWWEISGLFILKDYRIRKPADKMGARSLFRHRFKGMVAETLGVTDHPWVSSKGL